MLPNPDILSRGAKRNQEYFSPGLRDVLDDSFAFGFRKVSVMKPVNHETRMGGGHPFRYGLGNA